MTRLKQPSVRRSVRLSDDSTSHAACRTCLTGTPHPCLSTAGDQRCFSGRQTEDTRDECICFLLLLLLLLEWREARYRAGGVLLILIPNSTYEGEASLTSFYNLSEKMSSVKSGFRYRRTRKAKGKKQNLSKLSPVPYRSSRENNSTNFQTHLAISRQTR